MGAKEGKEATPEEIKTFFAQSWYNQYFLSSLNRYHYSGCVDIEKLKQELVSPEKYVPFQYLLEKDFEKVDFQKYKTMKQYKELFRNSIPDSKRRDIILQMFNINPMSCESRYQTLVKLAGDDFLEHTHKAKLASKALEYHFLNEKGIHQLEIILALLFKERHIKHSPLMIQVASLLLLFLKPGEVYHVLVELINSSQEALKTPDGASNIRWHLTFEKGQYFKLLSTFVRSYLNTTVRKKRSVLKHMNKISFDFNQYVDASFKSLTTRFVPLPVAIDILMKFLVEGVKILFRYTYAILKHHKSFVKKSTNGQEFLQALKEKGRTDTDPDKLHKAAFKYPLKRGNYDFKKATTHGFIDPKTGQASVGGEDFHDYVPNCPFTSTVVVYEEFSIIWRMLPDYVKIRVPELLYTATSDGFNLQNLYRKMAPYKNEYKFCLILIQTKNNQVFGAFIDEVIRKSPKNYLGSSESFLFVIKPEVKVFYDQGQNQRFFLGELEYFQIGGEGEGPAVWVNETLTKGQTNRSETFRNELLTLGEKDKDELMDQSISQKSIKISRIERAFARFWTKPFIPMGLFIGHLYLIALFLRNPFQKVDLD